MSSWKPEPQPAPVPVQQNADHLASRFAHTITGPYKQDIAMLLQGQKGSGKSYASLRIAYNTARQVAEILDDDWHEWPKYFSMENVAIIDPERASEVIGNAKLHNIYIFDDIGVGWNSRAFASKENRDKNDIFQINRVAQTVQILSMPNQFLIDKVPRMLCNYLAEMDRGMYGQGISFMKVFKTKTLFRIGNQQITPHLVAADGEKITKYVIHKPPKFLAKQYDRIRKDITAQIIAARSNREEEERPAQKERGMSRRTEEMYVRIIGAQADVDLYMTQGMTEKEAVQNTDIPLDTWYGWKSQGKLAKARELKSAGGW
ncbi:MAG: hypothetical protein PHN43_03165 [Patescibacteria group bacterium]|nr:hypothetical protein [Patescibacteria group bacterium]